MKKLSIVVAAVVLLVVGLFTGRTKDEILGTYNHVIQVVL